MKVKNPIHVRFQYLLEFRKTERKWHFPFLTALCVGSCLMVGYLLGKPNYGSLSSLGALVILYFIAAPIAKRMVHLAACSLGIVFSFAFCLLLGFNIYFSALSLGIVSFLAHFATSYFKIPAPGTFFFVLLAAMASNYKFNIEMIPNNVGLVAMGTILSCIFAFIYSVFVEKGAVVIFSGRRLKKRRYTKFVESLIIGFFMALTLLIGHILNFNNTYWISISAIAIIQGQSFEHVRQRSIHRILGTFIGIGFTWAILLLNPEKIAMIFVIIILRYMIDFLVVRNYGFTIIFVTPLTILLAEMGSGVYDNVETLMSARLIDTVIGSIIGALAGFLLHHQQIINKIEKNIRFSYFQFKKIKK